MRNGLWNRDLPSSVSAVEEHRGSALKRSRCPPKAHRDGVDIGRRKFDRLRHPLRLIARKVCDRGRSAEEEGLIVNPGSTCRRRSVDICQQTRVESKPRHWALSLRTGSPEQRELRGDSKLVDHGQQYMKYQPATARHRVNLPVLLQRSTLELVFGTRAHGLQS